METDEELNIFVNESARKIVKELNYIYPDRRTPKQLMTAIAETSNSDVHAKLRLLKANGFIHKLNKEQEIEFLRRVRKGSFPAFISPKKKEQNKEGYDPKSAKYIIEDVSNSLHQSLQYQLAPGYFQYTKEFQTLWSSSLRNLLTNRQLEDFRRDILNILDTLFKPMRLKKYCNIVPRGIVEGNSNYACSNCGIDHESRNFIRAIILHLLDDLEVSNDFINFLYDQKIANENGHKLYRMAHDKFINEMELSPAQKDLLTIEAAEAFVQALGLDTSIIIEMITKAKPEMTEIDVKNLIDDKVKQRGVSNVNNHNTALTVAYHLGIDLKTESIDTFLKERAEIWFENLNTHTSTLAKMAIEEILKKKPEITKKDLMILVERYKERRLESTHFEDSPASAVIDAARLNLHLDFDQIFEKVISVGESNELAPGAERALKKILCLKHKPNLSMLMMLDKKEQNLRKQGMTAIDMETRLYEYARRMLRVEFEDRV